MFKRTTPEEQPQPVSLERVTSVLGPGINWSGNLGGKGGIRIEGTFEGEIRIRGLVVIGETGRVTCQHLRANNVIVAGALRGNITAEKLEIRSTGRVWGDETGKRGARSHWARAWRGTSATEGPSGRQRWWWTS